MKVLGFLPVLGTMLLLVQFAQADPSGAAEIAAERPSAGDTPKGPAPSPEDKQAAVAALRQLGVRVELDESQAAQSVAAVKTKITDVEIVHLAALPELESLDISGGQITDAGLANLRGLVELKRLYLRDLPITDAGLEHLQGLTGLEVLTLSNAKISGKGLAQLRDLKQLRVLNLSGNPIVGVKKLYDAIPGLSVHR